MSPALSGILTAIAVFVWAGVVAFWSRRWSVWAVTILSVVAFYLWTAAIDAGRVDVAVWLSSAACLSGIAAIVVLMRRAAE